jgi:hypothetical protein
VTHFQTAAFTHRFLDQLDGLECVHKSVKGQGGTPINQMYFINPFLHQQLSQNAYTDTHPKTPMRKQCRYRSTEPLIAEIKLTSVGVAFGRSKESG